MKNKDSSYYGPNYFDENKVKHVAAAVDAKAVIVPMHGLESLELTITSRLWMWINRLLEGLGL